MGAFCCSGLRKIHLPDSFVEFGDGWFCDCWVFQLFFWDSPSLRRIGLKVFCSSGLQEVHIPDSVEELVEECFGDCKTLSRVTFAEFLSLKRISGMTSIHCSFPEIFIPISVQ